MKSKLEGQGYLHLEPCLGGSLGKFGDYVIAAISRTFAKQGEKEYVEGKRDRSSFLLLLKLPTNRRRHHPCNYANYGRFPTLHGEAWEAKDAPSATKATESLNSCTKNSISFSDAGQN